MYTLVLSLIPSISFSFHSYIFLFLSTPALNNSSLLLHQNSFQFQSIAYLKRSKKSHQYKNSFLYTFYSSYSQSTRVYSLKKASFIVLLTNPINYKDLKNGTFLMAILQLQALQTLNLQDISRKFFSLQDFQMLFPF